MYEGLNNLLELKGMGLTRDPASNMPKAYSISSLIPIIAAQALPKQRPAPMPMAPAPMPPQMSQPVYRYDGGPINLEEGGKLDGGDYVIDAYTVAALGNGSSNAGGAILDEVLPDVPNTDNSAVGLMNASSGDGMSDNIAFEVVNGGDIEGAMISQDEYILDANQVEALGNGDIQKGVALLEETRKDVRKEAYGTKKQPNQISTIEALRKLIKET